MNLIWNYRIIFNYCNFQNLEYQINQRPDYEYDALCCVIYRNSQADKRMNYTFDEKNLNFGTEIGHAILKSYKNFKF